MPLQRTLAPYSRAFFFLTLVLTFATAIGNAQTKGKTQPWMNTKLSPDERAAMVVKELTIDEKISLLHGTGMVGLSPMSPLAIHSNGGAG